MRRKKGYTDSIAKERLRFMAESQTGEGSPDLMMQLKKEISDIVARYFDISPEEYEVKVILKQIKKRA